MRSADALRPRLLLAGAVAACSLLVGCGSGGKLSASDYRTQGDASCTDAHKRLLAVRAPASAGEVNGYLQKELAIAQEAQSRFAALHPPSSLQADHQAVVDLKRKQVAAVGGLIDQTRGKSNAQTIAAFKSASAGLGTQDQMINQRYRALGLRVCGTSNG